GITTPVGATKATTTSQDIYTLTGIRRKNLGKGVNIVNGRKVIIK
ncbi:MAG: peptidase, partial [Bacteroidaceae bacterium]|nr:peptidase [Bacteroidaceae bacterium]